MSDQIFTKPIPVKIMFDFLDKYAIKTKYYLVNKDTFKKAKFNNDIDIFCNNIKTYYYNCKQFYVTRTQNYKTFITILRQICKYNHLPFTSKIKYDKSNYEIYYYIYPQLHTTPQS